MSPEQITAYVGGAVLLITTIANLMQGKKNARYARSNAKKADANAVAVAESTKKAGDQLEVIHKATNSGLESALAEIKASREENAKLRADLAKALDAIAALQAQIAEIARSRTAATQGGA